MAVDVQSFVITTFTVSFKGIGDWLWRRIVKPITSIWSNNTKPSSSYNNETKPSSIWTNKK